MVDALTFRRIAVAYDLAIRSHEGQTRRSGRCEPFVNHVGDVALRVSRSEEADEVTLIAAVLHDIVEKTDCSLAYVEAAFGAEVASIVAELTDDPALSEEERRRAQIEEAPSLSARAKRIKLADKASKLALIAAAPPHWWGLSGIREELQWARDVAAGLRGVDRTLEADFDGELGRAEVAVGRSGE